MFDTNHNQITKSAIIEHSHSTKHLICFDQTKILASTPFHTNQDIREAIEIKQHPISNFNHDDDYHLS